MPAVRVPRRFIMAPLHVESRREINSKRPAYEELKKIMHGWVRHSYGGVGFFDFLERHRISRKTSYGVVIDTDVIAENVYHPVLGELCQTLYSAYAAENPNATRAAQRESLILVKQLTSLGFGVGIQNSTKREQEVFVRTALNAGAKRIGVNTSKVELPGELKKFVFGTTWARDQYVKIGGRKETPKVDLVSLLEGKRFGEGGSMVQIGPKEFAIEEKLIRDPRVAVYTKKGFRFQLMPKGAIFDQPLSDLFGTKVYTTAPHLDMTIGAIPDRKIVATDPHYFRENKLVIEQLRRNFGVSIVEVPESEADRCPQNFLPLGKGRVLVDSGAQNFIHKLQNAGATVIPTEVPLNALLSIKGGLHCLFNEH